MLESDRRAVSLSSLSSTLSDLKASGRSSVCGMVVSRAMVIRGIRGFTLGLKPVVCDITDTVISGLGESCAKKMLETCSSYQNEKKGGVGKGFG